MSDSRLPPELRAAGVGQGNAQAPDVVTLEWLQGENSRHERILRLQYEGGELPGEWEGQLRLLEGDNTTAALKRWAYLKHLWRVRHERLEAAEESPMGAAEAARALLRREPVVVWLGPHRVEVTGRSYSAMAEIAVHDLTRRQLEDDLRQIAAITVRLRQQMSDIPTWAYRRRNPLRRRLSVLGDLYQRAYTERELHRRAIYAHALTKDGGPASDPATDAPDWWREMGPEEDADLLVALLQAGPLRYQAIGQMPPSEPGGMRLREDFGFASLFASWEKEYDLRPGELYDRDLGQLLASMRAGAMELSDKRLKALS